ncbi:MAG: DUF1772 domain-containing protein [Pyrinomonadaceae bacterium]|nr:DUF1772 domain-containing protein [Pyrinomonadaceae bacterium]
MRPLTMVRVITVVCTGLLAGIFLGYLVSAPARGALSTSSFVQHQQVVHVYYASIAPALILAALIAGLTWLFMVRSNWRSAEFWLTAGATGGIVFITVLTRAVNVPLNEQLMTWSIAAPPANVRELWATWEFSHMIRTIVAVVAFLLAVGGMATGNSDKPATSDRKGA